MSARVFEQSEIKMCRFSAEVVSSGHFSENVVYQYAPPLPVRGSDGELIGFAALAQEANTLQATAATQPQFKDRLDIENGEKRYLHPELRIDGDTVTVVSLKVSEAPTMGAPIYGLQVE